MKVVVCGAGAIGSLLGAYLAKDHDVTMVGRKAHMDTVAQMGLTIEGKSSIHVHPATATDATSLAFAPDLVLVTVKAYDTAAVAGLLPSFVGEQTVVCSVQNGLGNIEALASALPARTLLAAVTTHGAYFERPGTIVHTGWGTLTLGAPDPRADSVARSLAQVFSAAGLPAIVSPDIGKEIWGKAVVNSSINPLTAFLSCPNGYLAENPILSHVVDCICQESTSIAVAAGISVTYEDMLAATRRVISDTAENRSSMLQSLQRRSRTEIDALNGAFVRRALDHGVSAPLNRLLVDLITWKEREAREG